MASPSPSLTQASTIPTRSATSWTWFTGLEVVITAKRVDLLLRALDQDEAAQPRALRPEDGRVEALDPPVLRKAVKVSRRRLLQEVERVRFASTGGNPPSDPEAGFSHGFPLTLRPNDASVIRVTALWDVRFGRRTEVWR
jgi:hypothetical protein